MKKITWIFPVLLAFLVVLFGLNYVSLAVGATGDDTIGESVEEKVSGGVGEVTDRAEDAVSDVVSDADSIADGMTDSDTEYQGNISTDDNGIIGSSEKTESQMSDIMNDEAEMTEDVTGSSSFSWIGIVVTIIVVLAIICVIVALVPKNNESSGKKN